MPHIIGEMTKIELHPHNMNREDGFCLSKPWKALTCSLRDCGKPPSQDSQDRFSTGPCGLRHTALIWAMTLPFLGIHQSWAFIPFPTFPAVSCSSYLLLHAYNPHIWLLSHLCHFSARHTHLWILSVLMSASGRSSPFQDLG
jgi:hypothetical protein